MKKFLNHFLPVCILIGLQACDNADRNGRDKAATELTDSLTDTTQRAQAVTADVDLNGDGKVFALSAGTGGMMEVEAAGLALKRSKSKLIKDFATTMLKDHKSANEELKKIADANGIQLAQSLPAEMAEHLSKMNSLEDRAFDVQYMRMMINDHKKTMQLFTDGSRLADPELRAFAVKTFPLIKQHYESAVKIGNGLNISNAGNGDDLMGISPAKVEKK